MAQRTTNLTELLDTFQLIDKNKDGSISFDEFRIACEKLQMPFDEQRIKEFSAEKNSISFDEFCSIMQQRQPISPDTLCRDMFRAFDKNSDGFISVKEIKQTMKELGEKLSTKQAKEMLKAADANGDGKLSQEEFRALFDEINRFSLPNLSHEKSNETSQETEL